MKSISKNSFEIEAKLRRLLFPYGFWLMFGLSGLIVILFAVGTFEHGRLKLGSLLGRVMFGYVALCMATGGIDAVRVARSEFRARHTTRSLAALIVPWIIAVVLLWGSAWLFWRIFPF